MIRFLFFLLLLLLLVTPLNFAYASCTNDAECNNHGTCVSSNCNCNPEYTDTNCEQCNLNYYDYPTCRFCNAATTCNNRGTCDSNGYCVCDNYWTGTDCNSCPANMNSGCTACLEYYFGVPNCQLCSNKDTCNNHGECSLSGTCDCFSGYTASACNLCLTNYYGPTPYKCAYCLASTTCNNHGACVAQSVINALVVADDIDGALDISGTCTCNTGYAGSYCGQCAAEYVGFPNCVNCHVDGTCNGHGVCLASGACACNTGYDGSSCQQCTTGYTGYPNCVPSCNTGNCIHGTCITPGTCQCDLQWAGSTCNTCNTAAGYYGTNCDVYCKADSTCLGHGTCNSNGLCSCNNNFQGTSCDLCVNSIYNYPSCDTACNSGNCVHGTCIGNGDCSCDQGWATPAEGSKCSVCTSNYYGSSCNVYCHATTTCNGHGSCNSTGVCVCAPSHQGTHCDQCAPDHQNPPLCDKQCYDSEGSGTVLCVNGVCQLDTGLCQCLGNWDGTSCDACKTGFYGGDCSTKCNAQINCGGFGICNEKYTS